MVTRALPGECPFEKSPAEGVTRRAWARYLLGAIVGSMATLLYPIVRYVSPPAGVRRKRQRGSGRNRG